jgi:hypothetical protein
MSWNLYIQFRNINCQAWWIIYKISHFCFNILYIVSQLMILCHTMKFIIHFFRHCIECRFSFFDISNEYILRTTKLLQNKVLRYFIDDWMVWHRDGLVDVVFHREKATIFRLWDIFFSSSNALEAKFVWWK